MEQLKQGSTHSQIKQNSTYKSIQSRRKSESQSQSKFQI
jgi:hypothetical protein